MSNSCEEALDNFNKSLEYNPHNINAPLNMGKLYLEAGLIDETIEIFNQILNIDPNNIDATVMLYILNNYDE